MRKVQTSICNVVFILLASAANAQTVFEDDIQDFDNSTGVGCYQKDAITKGADFYFVCKSLRSGEAAWNAVLYRGKLACAKEQFSLFFNVPPSLPKESGIYGAQAEINCGTKP